MQPLWRGIWQYLTKLHVSLHSDILVRHHLEDIPATTQKYTYTRLFIAALFVIAKYYKPHIRPYKRMNILWNIHTMESVFAVAEKQEEGEISKN